VALNGAIGRGSIDRIRGRGLGPLRRRGDSCIETQDTALYVDLRVASRRVGTNAKLG